MADRVAAFLAMLERGQDSALLRFSLGNEYLAQRDPAAAVVHLEAAVAQDRNYSAAWKLLGKAFAENGEPRRAIEAWRTGIEVAGEQGDRQAAREMQVFVRRAERAL
ncbi:MAG TPA: tetratricopeptide repeat protein [Woeseiaceae bacterium]|nr:tetratricopeptide repeat protein [Woeseiaceae bacterium]